MELFHMVQDVHYLNHQEYIQELQNTLTGSQKVNLTVTERDDYTPTERGGSVLPSHFIIGVSDAYR